MLKLNEKVEALSNVELSKFLKAIPQEDYIYILALLNRKNRKRVLQSLSEAQKWEISEKILTTTEMYLQHWSH